MPFSPTWNDLLSNQLTWRPLHEVNESCFPHLWFSSATGAQEPQSGMETLNGLGDCPAPTGMTVQKHPGQDTIPPRCAHLSQSRFGQCCLETRGRDTGIVESEGCVGMQRSPRLLVESVALALPSAQSFPPASLISITSSRNANQCICKTWK